MSVGALPSRASLSAHLLAGLMLGLVLLLSAPSALQQFWLGLQQGFAPAASAAGPATALSPLSPAGQLGIVGLGLLPALAALRSPRQRVYLQILVLSLILLALLAWWLPTRGLWMDASPALAALALGLVLHQGWQQRRAQAEAVQQAWRRELLQATNEAKREFLHDISHELRSPLSALLGLSELLAQGRLDPTQRRQVQLLGSAGRSLLTLVDELLDLGRLDEGQLRLHPAPAQLPQLLDDVMALLRGRADVQQVRLELVLAPDVPSWVLVDVARLQQVLQNLIGNAIRFTPKGHVALHVSRLTDGRLEFAVSDTGIGIASSQLQRIFEPFVHSPGEGRGRYGGTGLGLTISRELVQLMGGELEVQSVPGAGSRFAFALPLESTHAPAQPAAPGAPLPAGLQLLLAEGDEVVAEVLRAQLQPAVEAHGLHIERAGSGHLALALAKRIRFDLVLLDLQLPGLHGLRVVRELREFEAREGRPPVPILALSSNAMSDDSENSLAAGCDEQLNKPVSQQQLLQALARWAPAEAVGEVPPPLEMPRDELEAKRRAHARVFLGRWHEAWATARNDKESALALLRDLLECADALETQTLREASAALLALLELPVARMHHQHQREQAVLAAVEETLVALRPAS